MARTKGVFVTGTGTGVGKTVVAASIVAGLTARGHRVAAYKPVVTGLDEPDATWPLGDCDTALGDVVDPDMVDRENTVRVTVQNATLSSKTEDELLAGATGWQAPRQVAPYTFGPAVSPHLAAEMANRAIDPERLIEEFVQLSAQSELTVCEGVGGLLVPLSLDPPFSVLDLAKRIALPVVVAARPGLGTINDTRLAVERLRSEQLEVAAVVLSGWPSDATSGEPSAVELSNRETIAHLLDVEVAVLKWTTPDDLANAAESLSLASWIGDDGRGL
ncbi:MAG: ATP-dependent dethiobiotin synthetase BioD [Solirubrobacterales bacterium]